VLEWLRGYDRAWLGADVVAGLTAAAVVVPKAMAYATIAGVPVQVGLYTALVPALVYALVGGSRVLSVSSTTTIAILTAAALQEAAPDASPARLLVAVATLSVLVGAMLVAAAILRLGFVANFISEPVLGGFKAAIGVVIVVDQLPKLLGVHVEKAGFLRDLARLAGAARHASLPTVALSVALVALLLALMRWAPRVPAPLVAIAVGIGASAALGLPAAGVKAIGPVPAGLPSPVWPELALLGALWPAAVGIALMSFTETIAAGRAFAGPRDPRPSPNRELFATGLAGALGGLLGAMPAGGGTSQTALNRRVGARSQLAGLVIGLTALAALLALGPVLSRMPQATLAVLVIVYSVELVSLKDFRAVAAVRRTELLWSVTAFAGVLFLGTLRGIVVAVVVSLVSLMQQAQHPRVYELRRKPGTNVFRRRTDEHPEDEAVPGLLLLRVEGRIYFGNAERVIDLLTPIALAASPRVIVLDGSAIFDLEYSALKMLGEAEERVREHGAELWLAALNPGVRAVVERSPLGARLGRDRMCFHVEDAVDRFRMRAGSPEDP
jgi:high affinity sulfate transporter 1